MADSNELEAMRQQFQQMQQIVSETRDLNAALQQQVTQLSSDLAEQAGELAGIQHNQHNYQGQQGQASGLRFGTLKLEKPPYFDGTPGELTNFLFQLEQYLTIAGVDDDTDKVKYGVTLLHGRALTWWRGVADKPFYKLGVMEFDEWSAALTEQFQDIDRELRLRRKLHNLKQTHSVAAYTAAFRGVLLELGSRTLSDGDSLFQYIEGLKPAVRQQVYLQRPSTLGDAQLCAERADGALYFSGERGGARRQQPYDEVVPMELGAAAGEEQGSQSGAGRGNGGGWQPRGGPGRGGGAGRGGRDRGRGAGRGGPGRGQARGDGVCWGCGQAGHLRRNCPNAPKN